MGLFERLARAGFGAQSGGYLSTPPGLTGDPGLGISAFSGVPRPSEWDAVVSADAAALTGGEVHFVALADGKPASDRTPELDALGKARSPDFALRADRLDETNWEVEVSPL